jgi:hypothetical protein
MGKVIDKIRAKRANNSVITAEDSSFQVGNEEPQEANVVSNTTEQEKKTKPINTEIPQVDLSHEANPVISVGDFNNKEQEANTQKDFFGLENSLSNWQKPNVPQGDIPDESKLTIVEDIKNNNELKSTTTPSESQAIYNMYMDSVIERAKGMEGGLTSENIQKAQQELSVPRLKQSSLDTNITFEEKKEEQPKTAETPQATEEKKQFGDDWLYEFSKINPKPNVLSDLGFHGFEKHSVPDNLLNLWGKDLKGAIDDIKDENGNSLTDEQKKKILRRIRGVRAGQALMQIANIATQAAAVSQGGTPVKMDNSSILGKIHNQAQAKKDAWLKQAIKAKETANKNKIDMLNYQLDLQKALWGKEDKDLTREIQKQKAILDWQRENRLISEFEYRMKKDALTLEEQKRHNQVTENISQQNANTNSKRQTGESASKDYTIYKINGKPTAFLVKDIEKMSGEIVGNIKKVLESYKQLDDSKLAEKGFDNTTALNRKIRELNEQIKDPETYFAIWMKEFPEETKSVANKYAANDAISEFVYKTKYGNDWSTGD